MPRWRTSTRLKWYARRRAYYAFGDLLESTGCFGDLLIGIVVLIIGGVAFASAGVWGLAFATLIILLVAVFMNAPIGRRKDSLKPADLAKSEFHKEQKGRFEVLAGRPMDWTEYSTALKTLRTAGYTWNFREGRAVPFDVESST